MKKGLVLSRKQDLHSIQRFLSEAPACGVDLMIDSPENILLKIETYADFDFAIPRFGTYELPTSLQCLQQLEKRGVPSLNSARDIEFLKDKLSFALAMSNLNLPTPLTYPVSQAESLSWPFIVKPRRGSKGEGIELMKSKNQWQKWQSENTSTDFIVQEYISSSHGMDLRIHILNQNIVGAHKRLSQNQDFRSNLAQGGRPEPHHLTEREIELALQLSRHFPNSKWLGLDLLFSERGPLLLEANTSPGFLGLETSNHLNMARLVLQTACDL